MFHVKHHRLPEAEGLDRYEALVRRYHRTLDLVSEKALGQFPRLIEQARAYATEIAALAPSARILDVGSGVGLPGIVIAAALPHQPVVLVERRRRRATFLASVVAQLALENALVIESDVRDLTLDGLGASGHAGLQADLGLRRDGPLDQSPLGSTRTGFGVVTAQAVATVRDVYCLTRHLHADRVLLVSRKGPNWKDEVAALANETGVDPTVLADVTLPESGTLVAIEAPGGLSCPPSG